MNVARQQQPPAPNLVAQVPIWAGVGLVAGIPLGIAVGARGAASLPRRAVAGALVGALAGIALVAIDVASGGYVRSGFRTAWSQAQDRHQLAFVARNAISAPWLYPTARRVHHDAEVEQWQVFRQQVAIDDAGDAYRHAWASAALVLRTVQQRGWDVDRAVDLARDAGAAHERDGVDNPAGELSSAMDAHNNNVGTQIARTIIRAGSGEEALRTAVLAALESGRLQVIEEGALQASHSVAAPAPARPRGGS